MTTSIRTAILTGGASGIGLATAQRFARQDMNVVIADINGDAATQAAREIEEQGGGIVSGCQCDVTDEKSVRAVVDLAMERHGRVDIFLASAGMDLHHDLAQTSIESWRKVQDVNVTGAFLFMKHLRDIMIAQKYGRIICMGSSSGIFGMGYPAYSSAKAALQGLALSSARELAPHGVTVNVVAPGPTETAMSLAMWASNPGRRKKLEGKMPVRRVARPAEIAGAINYLASEEAGYVTGSTLVIDGGLTSLFGP
ncbi:MAG: SDR family oxidoreductase [Mesorhizobium sp.]|nr:SDR family oxidoreductase [Mesorhizobium sp.]